MIRVGRSVRSGIRMRYNAIMSWLYATDCKDCLACRDGDVRSKALCDACTMESRW